ncbi:MAG: hypothetical protein ACRD1D_05115 [Acidimicrobiales bacterium]
MKFVASLGAVGTVVGAAGYMAVSLNRWEWNRALFFGLIVLIAEVAIATALILRRLARMERRNAEDSVPVIVRETRPASPNRFAWLDESTERFSVFITFLVGGGVILSGVAWVVDRIAAATSTPIRERQLARQLDSISYPAAGLLVDDVTVLAQDVPGADDVQIRKLLGRAGLGS